MVVRVTPKRVIGTMVATILACTALTACGGASSATNAGGLVTINIGLPQQSGAQILPEIAQEAGFFKEAGVTANIKIIDGSQAVLAAMNSGSLQFGNADALTALRGQISGLGTEIIGVPIVKPIFDLIASNDVKTPADLVGKRVGITGIGNSTDFQVQAALTSAGVDPKKVNEVALQGYDGIFAGLTAGQINAGTVAVPFNDELLATGKFHQLIDLRAISSAEYPTAVFTTTEKYASQNPEIVQKVTEAYVKAIRLFNSDPDFVKKAIKKVLKLNDDKEVQETYDFFKPLFREAPTPTTDMMNTVLPALVQAEHKGKDELLPIVGKAVHPEYVDKAVKAIGNTAIKPDTN